MSESGKAVFLSYASQDAEAAKRIADALRATGVEVWFDRSELVGGDAWDQKIRKQIKECALLIPIISENTQARTEGYFRLEWRLADQRTHLMAKGRAFLLPVVIDDTPEADAAVPDSFLDVQWSKAPGGAASPAFCTRVKDLLRADPSARTKVPRFKGQWSNSPLPESVTGAAARKRPRWLAPVLGGAAVAIIALVLARPWDRPASPPASSLPPAVSPSNPPPASAAPSEARQLAERAMAIRRQTEVTVEDLMAAAGMCDRALTLDPLDAQVWAAASMVDTRIVQAEYDKSDARRQQAQKKAARALVLAPGAFEPRWAQALALAYAAGTPEMRAEAEKIFRALAKEEAAAGRRDFQIDFGTFLRDTGQMGEAAAIFERVGDLQSAGWNYFAARDAAAAERVVERMLASERTPGGVLLKVFVAGVLRQDLEAAHAAVDLFTPTELLNASPVRVAIYIRLSQRQPERVIALVNAFPQDFIFAAGVAQPKRYFSGLAHEMAGRAAAARAEWQVALQQVAERLKATPNDRDMVSAHALLLACLGEKEAAEREFQLLRGLSGPAGIKADEWWIGLRLGHTEEALAALTKVLRNQEPNWWFVHLGARTQVQWDALRGDPRFEKLLRETLPPGAKPFEDDKTTDNGPLTAAEAKP
jgi:hypothetical protein